jgi:SAM-dependent methyltransferase
MFRDHATAPFAYAVRRMRHPGSFTVSGKTYTYFVHYYNYTWRNERTVEVPIILETVRKYAGQRVLEVGNVLQHYAPVQHHVLDKFERSPGVINVDLIDYKPEQPYDCIVSISTLEHVGWDDNPRDPEKPLRAVEHLRTLLAPGGVLLMTIPLGYNPFLDAALREKRIAFTHTTCLRRVSARNEWREVAWEEVTHARYNSPYPAANGLIIAEIRA